MNAPRTIGFSTPTMNAAAVKAMLQGFAYACEQRGAHVVVTDAQLDGDRQAAQIDQITETGVAALVVYPVATPAALRPALDRAVESGLLLFSHDDVDHPAVITEFITPGAQMAVLSANLLDELLGGRGDVAIIGGIPAPQILERTDAFKQALQERHTGLRLVAEASNPTDDAPGAREVVTDILAAHPELAGILTYNDASAIGAAEAVETPAEHSIVIVGCNGEPECLEAIRAGRVAGTVERHPIELGQRAADLILDVLDGTVSRESAPSRIASEPEVITAANVNQFRPWQERTPQPDWARTCRFL
jgi:ribose transport system substrate-binding protein